MAAGESEDWYAVLGVSEDATDKALQSAFRKRAVKCHPDKFPGDAAKAAQFTKLQKALEMLSNPAKRAALDSHRKATENKRKRDGEMDARRKDLRTALEQREKEAAERLGKAAAEADKKDDLKSRIREQLAQKRAAAAAAGGPATHTPLAPTPLTRPPDHMTRAHAHDHTAPSHPVAAGGGHGPDYETVTMHRMRQAQERRRLADEILAQEAAAGNAQP